MFFLLKIAFAKAHASYQPFNKDFNKILPCLICAVYIFTVCGCQENARTKPVATVDGVKISISEFNERFTREMNVSMDKSPLTPADYDRLKEEVLNALINEKVMLLRAGELSISVSDAELMKKIDEIKESYLLDDGFERVLAAQRVNYGIWKEELRKRMMLEKLILSDVNANVTVKENEARQFHITHRGMYAPEKRVHVAQIVVRKRERAEMILNRLKRGENFDKVAELESIGPEGAKGGDLGFVGPGVMPEEIDAVIFSQRPGEISSVIKSQYGYHIVKIIEIDKGTKKKWADVKERVLTDFRKQKEEQAYVLWLESLRSKAVIKIDQELLKKETVPLNNGTE
jgi:parvulin-like peptidyl-prolyl isomerase